MADSKPNVMTISWITPINNQGIFAISMNKRRHSFSNISLNPFFVLNVPVKGMEELVLAIGGCHGHEVDKIETFKLPLCRPGWGKLEKSSPLTPSVLEDSSREPHTLTKAQRKQRRKDLLQRASASSVALDNCVAHVLAYRRETQLVGDHALMTCEILSVHVLQQYWTGSGFCTTSKGTPPFLKFLGTKTFAYVDM